MIFFEILESVENFCFVVLEIKHSAEVYIGNKLEAGEHVSLQEAFNHAVNELVEDQDDDDWMKMF